MKHRLVLVLAVAAATVGFVPGSAQAAPTGPLCGVVTAETTPGTHAGYLFGGPTVGSGTLRCSVQQSPLYASADLASASATNSLVVTLNPTAVTFPSPGEDLYLCTAWTGPNGTVYLGDDRKWHDDPATVRCAPTTSPNGAMRDGWATFCATLTFVFTGTLLGTVTVEPDGDVYVNGHSIIVCSGYQGTSVSAFAGRTTAPTVIRIGG